MHLGRKKQDSRVESNINDLSEKTLTSILRQKSIPPRTLVVFLQHILTFLNKK